MHLNELPMRCLIVDDSAQFVTAARGLLEHQGVNVVGVASTGADAIRCYDELRPDVTLVDLDLGCESGFDVAELIHHAAGPSAPPIILISTHAAADFAEMIAASPAAGFVTKSALSLGAIRDLVGRRDHASAGLREAGADGAINTETH
jgi:DNA-binding NarL/FixJ family response regulator